MHACLGRSSLPLLCFPGGHGAAQHSGLLLCSRHAGMCPARGFTAAAVSLLGLPQLLVCALHRPHIPSGLQRSLWRCAARGQTWLRPAKALSACKIALYLHRLLCKVLSGAQLCT